MMDRVKLIAVVATLCCAGAGGAAGAEQFRVENRVFVGDEKEPRIESTTIFSGNVAYDYLAKPEEITIFDRNRGRFVLLDVSRRLKTEVSTEHVREFSERLKQRAGTQPDAFLKFLVDPHFDEHFDEGADEATFSSPWMTYRMVTTEIEDAEVLRSYTEFSDWFCQLNTLLNPGARPQFARMQINAALESRRLFPQEVHLTLRTKDSLLAKRITVRSDHQLTRNLLQSDRDRLAQTDQYLAIFSPVKFDEYQRKIRK